MIAIVRSSTYGGSVVYQGLLQIDEHEGVPIFEGALCSGGFVKDTFEEAREHAKEGLRRRSHKLPDFGPVESSVALIRGTPPGRVVYFPLVRFDDREGIPLFHRTAIGWFPEDVNVAIRLAQESSNG